MTYLLNYFQIFDHLRKHQNLKTLVIIFLQTFCRRTRGKHLNLLGNHLNEIFVTGVLNEKIF